MSKLTCHSRVGGNPSPRVCAAYKIIPPLCGVKMDPRLRGDDILEQTLTKHVIPAKLAVGEREMESRLITLYFWMPAFAGMTLVH